MKSKKESKKFTEVPLFMEFLNSKIDQGSVDKFLVRLENVFPEMEDKKIVKEHRECLKDHHLEGYRLLQTKFKDHVDHIITNKNFESNFSSWANFYLSSLRETKNEDQQGNLERRIRIGDRNGDWFSGILLYNFSLFCKYYGTETLRRCEAKIYFITRSKWEKYCSEDCKKSKTCKKISASAVAR